jgi:prepilin-type N-terminal cleavage/methylation domain-containing protein
MHVTRRTAGSDAGFTLIELLVVIVVLGLIAIPLGDAVIGFTRSTDATSQRMALSHDAQIVAAYFARDVAATGVRDYTTTDVSNDVPFAQSIQLNAAYDAGPTCGPSTTPPAAIRFLSDDWSTSSGTPTVTKDVVAYYLETAGTVRALHRLRCAAGSTSDIIVAHYVNPTTLTVTCSSTCTATSPPAQVTMSFTVTQPKVDPYPITVTGQRRQT